MSLRTPVVYVMIAGFCLALHNVILIGANAAGLPLWLAVLLSFTAVASLGYLLHAALTFRQPLGFGRFARYALAMSANIPLAYVTTWFWYAVVSLPMTSAAPIASVCMLALNFVLGRWAIAGPRKQEAMGR